MQKIINEVTAKFGENIEGIVIFYRNNDNLICIAQALPETDTPEKFYKCMVELRDLFIANVNHKKNSG